MSLKDKLMDDLKSAMKDKDTVRKNAVQMVRASVLQVEKDNKITLDDDGVIEVVAKEVKKRKDVLPEYEKSGRQDLVDELKREIEVLMAYLPQQMSEEEIEALVVDAIAQAEAKSMKDIGKVMAVIMPKTKGKADGKVINQFVRKHLS
ncbi:MAG: GatB/YqeY domain-containing protein [Clostridia bacterium]|nr:GatB/YqeY domain-containing protein [Clostridia bacterium]